MANEHKRVPSARSINGQAGEMEVLPSEGSAMFMTEVNPPLMTDKPSPDNATVLVGVPRKVSSTPVLNGEDDCSPDSLPPSPSSVLKNAGVELNLDTLTADGKSAAPMELLSQFINCVMREEYEAAQLLCEKVLEFEPNNSTVLEFLPVIKLRLELDSQLSSEEDESSESSESESNTSSSDNSSADADEQESSSDEVVHTLHRHCAHQH